MSGPLDADKQDYLLRDSHFCGVQYGVYDLHQFQRSLRLLSDSDDLCVGGDGVHAVEQFVLAKYYLTANVYRHKVRLITDQMIGRAIRLGIESDQLEEMAAIYRYDGTASFLANYCQWDDARFMDTFSPVHCEAPGRLSGEMLGRLRRRRLLRRVFSLDANQFHPHARTDFPKLSDRGYDAARAQAEESVAEFLRRKLGQEVPGGSVILHPYEIKSARESARNSEDEILIQTGAMPRQLTEESALLRSINAAVTVSRVEVYAPVTWPDPTEKQRLTATWQDDIRGLIESALRSQKKAGGQ